MAMRSSAMLVARLPNSLIWADGSSPCRGSMTSSDRATDDAVVVVPRDSTQEVKTLVARLKAGNRPEMEAPPQARLKAARAGIGPPYPLGRGQPDTWVSG